VPDIRGTHINFTQTPVFNILHTQCQSFNPLTHHWHNLLNTF